MMQVVQTVWDVCKNFPRKSTGKGALKYAAEIKNGR